MEKNKFEGFINRYSLGGEIESVIIKADDTTLSVKMISDDKTLLGSVEMSNPGFPVGSYGVYTTSLLKQLLSVLDSSITVDVAPGSLKLSDKGTKVNSMLAAESVIPKAPPTKNLPEFDIEVSLNSDFINKFVKSTAVLAESTTFTFVSKGGASEIILGYSTDANSNRISLNVDANVPDDVKPISFSSKYLKHILTANREASNATLKISTKGLANVKFEEGEYKSEYYLVEVKK